MIAVPTAFDQPQSPLGCGAINDKPSFWKSDVGLVAAITIPLVLIGVVVVAWVLWSSHVQQQQRTAIAQMKAQADELLAAGHAEPAAKRYTELLDYADQHGIKDDPAGALVDAKRQRDVAKAAILRGAHDRAQEQERRESEASQRFLGDIQPFLNACRKFQSACEEYSRLSNAAASSFDNLKAAMTSEAEMNKALLNLVGELSTVQKAYGAIPVELDRTRTTCDAIRSAASALDRSYIQNASAFREMSQVRLARITGANPGVDAAAARRGYSTLIVDAQTTAKLTLDTASALNDTHAPPIVVGNSLADPTAKPADAARVKADASSNTQAVLLTDLKEDRVDCWTDPAGRMVFHKGVSDWNGRVIAVNGEKSPHGLFMHPRERGRATVTYRLAGRYRTFKARIGIADNDDPQPQSAVTFRLIGDGKLLWSSEPFTRKGFATDCSVNISGVDSLQLVTEASGSHYFAHAVWLEPCVLSAPTAPSLEKSEGR